MPRQKESRRGRPEKLPRSRGQEPDRRDRSRYHQSNSPKRSRANTRTKRDRMKAAGFLDDRREEDTNRNYAQMNMQQLEARRADEMREQDEALDAIEKGVIGLKNHAQNINNEVLDQNAMLDDLGENMESAQEELVKETERARKVNASKAKVCKLYAIIIFCIILLIVVLGA